MRALPPPGRLLLAAAVLGPLAGPAAAQEFPRTGVMLTFDVSQRLEVDSNLDLDVASPGTSTVATTRLDFGLRSETGTRTLVFGAAAALRAFDVPTRSDHVDLDNPDLRLSYTREGAGSLIEFSARYIRSDITFIRPLADSLGDPDIPDLLVDLDDLRGGGWREDHILSARLETGTDGPLGFAVSAAYLNRDYEDTTNPDLTDILTRSVSAEARLAFSPVTTGTVRASFTRDTDYDVTTERTDTTTLMLGLAHEFSPVLRLSAELGPTWVRSEDGGTVTREEGIDGALLLTRALANGEIGLGLSADTDEDGTTTRLSVSRSLELPEGTLSGSFGVARGPDGNTELVGGLDYSQAMPYGTVEATLLRDVTFSDDDGDETRTEFAIGYVFPLTGASSLGIGASTSRLDNSDTGERETRTNLGLTYSYALDDRWGLNIGYRHRLRDEGLGEARSDVAFLTIRRHFDGGW